MKKRNYSHSCCCCSDESRRHPFPADATPLMLCNMITKIFEDCSRNDDISLTNSGRHIMRFLGRHEGVTQLELANAANIKAPTVSVTLQKMEIDGMVRRETDEHDLRQTRVFLTDKGRAFNEKIKTKINDMDVEAFVDFTEEEQIQLTELLKRAVINMVAYKDKDKK